MMVADKTAKRELKKLIAACERFIFAMRENHPVIQPTLSPPTLRDFGAGDIPKL